MDEQTPTLTQALSTVGLNEAADIFDVSVDTLRRRIKSGKLPEVVNSDGKYGATYTLAVSNLPAIADRENWTLNLDVLNAQGSPTASPQQSKHLEDLTERVIAAEVLAQSKTAQLEDRDNQLHQARSDLEQEKTERARLEAQLVESENSRGQLEGEIKEKAERLADAKEDRISLDLEHRELRESTAESISALSNDLDAARNEASTTAGERDELAKKLADAESSMGWWTRRRYQNGSN